MAVNDSKIKILLLGEAYHAKMLVRQLKTYLPQKIEASFSEDVPLRKNLSAIDILHLISPPLPVLGKVKRYGKPVLFHWIGTDVYQIYIDHFIKKWLKKRLILAPNVHHLTVYEGLQTELASIGIQAENFPLASIKIPEQPPPLPQKFAVLAYVPHFRWQFFGGDWIIQTARQLPDVEFYIVASDQVPQSLPNVFPLGFVEKIERLYQKTSVLIRFTRHDGLPKMILEALSYGRQVLWTQSLPHCFQVKNVQEGLAILTKLKDECPFNEAGCRFVEENFHPAALAEKYYSLCETVLNPNEGSDGTQSRLL